MTSMQPDESSKKHGDDNSLTGKSLGGIDRVSFEGLTRGSLDYAKAIVSVCLLVHARRKVVVLDNAAKEAVRDLDIFEWNSPYPDDVRERSFPFFSGDRSSHAEMARLEALYVKLKRSQADGEPYKGTFLAEPIHPNTPTSYHIALVHIEHELDRLFDSLRRRCQRGISTPDGRMRATDFGELLSPLIHHKPVETGAQIVRMVLRAEDIGGKATRRPIVEHMSDLWDLSGETQPNRPARLEAFNMHLRKLGVSMLEGHFSFERQDLTVRAKRILCEGHVDTFLSGARTRTQQYRHRQAYNWLRGWDEGQHGSVPYPSWQGQAKDECFEEAFKIVSRGRHLSYHFFNRLRMETRSLGGNLSLLNEFAIENFSNVRFLRSDSIDQPPGPGTVMSGAKVDKLFHGLNPDRETLYEYKKDASLWFADQIPTFESATFVPMRQWFGVTADAAKFWLFGEQFYYVFENHHFSGNYLYGYAFPAVIVNDKLRAATYGLDDVPSSARDSGQVGLSIPDLIDASRAAGKMFLSLGHMSPLFGGMCNALPVGSKPVFGWEQQHQSTAWRDVYGHVHWPWLVYQFREQRARVDELVAPLAKADREIREFAIAGQKMVELFRHRYAAFKGDLLPGDVQAPRLLVKAYEIYRSRQERGAAAKDDETIYIGAQERTKPNFDPFPLINTSTLELMTRGKAHSTNLPKRGTGAGKAEIAEWNRSIGPLKQGKTTSGELVEGQYELMIIGERDIKR